jgi:hypothetical protein
MTQTVPNSTKGAGEKFGETEEEYQWHSDEDV